MNAGDTAEGPGRKGHPFLLGNVLLLWAVAACSSEAKLAAGFTEVGPRVESGADGAGPLATEAGEDGPAGNDADVLSSDQSSPEADARGVDPPFDADGSTSDASRVTVGCGRPRGQVSVGGVDGFAAFSDPNATTQLRACGASLYIHQVGWGSLTDAQKRAVATNFAGTGGISLEMAEGTNLAADYFSLGLSVTEVIVNAPNCNVPSCDDTLASWTTLVSSWQSQGVSRAEYNDTPNCPASGKTWTADNYTLWNTPTWDGSRALAQKGGGVVVDTPPSFYYHVAPQEYRDYIKAKIAWANGAGLHSTWIISPLSGTYDFVSDTQQLVSEINALPADRQPQEWAVENYNAGAKVGIETEAGSVANVALWVLMNGRTFAPAAGGE